MQFIAYQGKVAIRAARATYAQFQPSWGSAMRSIIVTAFIWLMLLLSDATRLVEKINESALLAVAFLLAFPVVFVWNWLITPSEIDGELARELAAANGSLARIASRVQTQEWLIDKANELRVLTDGLQSNSIRSDQFLNGFDGVWAGLIGLLSEGGAQPVVIYRLQNVSSHSTLAPTFELMSTMKLNLMKNVDEGDVERVARCFSFVNNLDAVIAEQGGNDG
jgi:hypothetical protein